MTLRDSRPLIWRRVRVSSDTTLAKLHRILQCVMGWEDAHLHKFVVQGQQYGLREKDHIGPRTAKDERQYKLGEVSPGQNSQFRYDYDFGTSGGYGFPRITEIGASIRQAAKERNSSAIRLQVAELSGYLHQVEVT